MEKKLKSGLRKMQKFLAVQNCMYHQRKKISNILKSSSDNYLSKDQKFKIRQYFSDHDFQHINMSWHQFYSLANGKFHENYIPEDIFFAKIEPALNRMQMVPGMLDKNVLLTLFKGISQPITIIKKMNGFFYDRDDTLIDVEEALSILLNYKEFIIKPTSIAESGEGNSVLLYTRNGECLIQEKMNLKTLCKKYGENFIVQEKVMQHKQMSLLNKSSLNTIRILSFLKNKEVHILSSVVRIGRAGKFVDNTSAGGISCGVNSNNKLKEIAYDSYGNQFDKTDSGLVLKDFPIPLFDKLKEAAINLHKKMPFFKLISWDLAIDKNDAIVLIEYNTFWQEINFHQLNNGPLFGKFTTEILAEAKKNEAIAKLVQIN